ncbi:glycosyltransferase [Formosa haliotis]|uniref:glycosyltransferase n=1 Tax=Formosa haliotis TaxID=1555194 RepID=UPI000826A383|nr:glycosyltransferase [Formosa haliotis]
MVSKKIKILFVLPSLKAGGAERVISYISKHLDKKKFIPILIVIGYKKDAVYTTNKTDVYYLNKSRVLKGVPPLLNLIIKTKPDIVLGSISHVNKLLSLISIFFPKIKFIGREASVITTLKKFAEPSKNKKINIFSNYHSFLDVIICQSKDMYNDLKSNYNIKNTKIVIINNPVSKNFKCKPLPYKFEKPIKYITIGTLHKRKGYDRIIYGLSKINHNFKYIIIGDGEELPNITRLIKALNLENKITHISYTNNVSKYLATSDVFLNGSYVEGFPNALVESCAIGTPVVAFEAPGGLNEIIINSKNGFLVKSENEFINTLNSINKNYHFNPKEINKTIKDRYDESIIIPKYESLFTELVSKK